MGSYIQVVVGLSLLLAAFFFGRFLNDQPVFPIVPSQAQETVPADVRSGGDSNDEQSSEPTPSQLLQQTLRERILGEREMRSAASTAPSQPPSSESKLARAQGVSTEDAIVVPDFSYLEQAATASGLKLPTTPQFDPLTSATRSPTAVPDPQQLLEVQSRRGESAPIDPSDSRYLEHERQRWLSETPNPVADSRSVRGQDLAASPSQFDSHSSSSDVDPELAASAREERSSSTQRGRLAITETVGRLVPVQHRLDQITSRAADYVTYKTVFGDTLHGLSTRFFGKPDFYLEIYLANKEIFANPSDVPVNKTIRIPVLSESSEASTWPK